MAKKIVWHGTFKNFKADLLKYGLRKWPDGTAVELNAGIYSHARLLVPMKQKITFQGPNWYVDVEDMGYSHED